jgi:hypothetical protein
MVSRLAFVILAISHAWMGLAQTHRIFIELKPDPKKGGFDQPSFNKVTFLDNRFDSSAVFIIENGEYPPTELVFAQPLTVAAESYVQNALAGASTGNQELMVNILKMNVANTWYEIRKKKFGVPLDMRNALVFAAEVYVPISGSYQQVMAIDTVYGWKKGRLETVIENALNDLIKRVIAIKKSTSAAIVPLSQINVNRSLSWQELPIIKNDPEDTVSGIYENFTDFKNDRIIKASVTLNLQPDSSYQAIIDPKSLASVKRIQKLNLENGWLWGLRANGKFFIKLGDNVFLPLQKNGNTFCFTIPRSLPDMYSLISAGFLNNGSPNSQNYSNFGGAAVSGIFSLIRDAGSNSRIKEILKNGKQSTFFRNCRIDLDSGDIIYQ